MGDERVKELQDALRKSIANLADARKSLRRGVERTKRLADEVIELVSVGQGRRHTTLVDLRELLADAVKASESSAFRRGVSLNFRAPDVSLSVVGSGDQLFRCFHGLLGDAVQSSTTGSTVAGTVEQASGAAVIRLHQRGCIPGGAQAWPGPIRVALARTVTERHRGSMWIDRQEAGGTELVLTLPLVAASSMSSNAH